MRISDWSSDVCSSDLGSWPAFDPSSDEEFVEGSGAQYLWMVPFDPAGLIEKLGGQEAATRRLDAFFRTPTGGWAVTKSGPLHAEQIGRASCRERGCQYV